MGTANWRLQMNILLCFAFNLLPGNIFRVYVRSGLECSSFSFSCCVADSGILALVQPAHEFILKIIYCICCFRFCLLFRSHTLTHTSAKSQNFLIALFVSTAAVVAFVFVIFLGAFFPFSLAMRWRHVGAFIFP